jgi:nucleoside-diphosphate-sugar epimerase
MRKETVLVTGANGLLGANIVWQLNQSGYLVKIIVRKGSDLKSLKDCKYELYEGNITDVWDLENAIQGCDYVIHSAAKTSQNPNHLAAYTNVNINSTTYLIELSKKYKIKKFVFISSANCFTNGTIENPGTENSSFMPWLRGSGYAFSKHIAQQIVLEEAEHNNFPAVVVAPTFMIGQRDSKKSSGKLLLYALKNKVIFYPQGGKSIVDVDYAAEAIVNSIEKGIIGQSYLISGTNMTYKNFFKTVSKVAKKKKLLIPIPSFLLSNIATVFSFFEKIFRISLPLNHVNQRLLCLNNYFSNDKAQNELELKPTSVEYSINKAIEWLKLN